MRSEVCPYTGLHRASEGTVDAANKRQYSEWKYASGEAWWKTRVNTWLVNYLLLNPGGEGGAG